MAQLIYGDAKGASVMKGIRTKKRAMAVLSHTRYDARLYTETSPRELIGEVYWHDDKGADCVQQRGAHWCYWFDPDALAE